MKKASSFILLAVLMVVGWYFLSSHDTTPASDIVSDDSAITVTTKPIVTPISHATFVLDWGGTIIYNDPVGGAEAFEGQPAADIVLVTDIHGDHLNVETLEAVLGENTSLIAPQAVVDELPEALAVRATLMANGEVLADEVNQLSIEAIPAYNLPDQGIEIRHEEGRGNGYLLERGGMRVYIAGDTADVPEMRALTDIDMAFIPMNLPYTMSVEDAADGVLAFAPDEVIPYHYRTPDGFSDVDTFQSIVEAANSDIEVVRLEWYPTAE